MKVVTIGTPALFLPAAVLASQVFAQIRILQVVLNENGFAFGGAIAPTLVIGAASDYLKFGFLATVAGDYRIRRQGGTIGLGLFAGAGKLYPKDDGSTIDLLLMPVGPSIRLEISYQTTSPIIVRLESNYSVFFEEVNPITAFSPSLAIEWRRDDCCDG